MGNGFQKLPEDENQRDCCKWITHSLFPSRYDSEVKKEHIVTDSDENEIIRSLDEQLFDTPTVLCLNKLPSVTARVLAVCIQKTHYSQIHRVTVERKKHLTGIPNEIGYLNNVTVLALSNNKISAIPWPIIYLRSLKYLDLSHNVVKSVPKTIGSLKSLVEFDLHQNLLVYLPSEIAFLENLTKFDVSGNDNLISPPPSVCEQGVEAIFNSIKDRNGRRNLWEDGKPWFTDPGEILVKSLVELSTHAVLLSGVDFLLPCHVPPVTKTKLAEEAKFQREQLNLSKCSRCLKYYTCQEKFDNHDCHNPPGLTTRRS